MSILENPSHLRIAALLALFIGCTTIQAGEDNEAGLTGPMPAVPTVDELMEEDETPGTTDPGGADLDAEVAAALGGDVTTASEDHGAPPVGLDGPAATGQVSAGSVNIRSGPSSDVYEIVTTVKRGTHLTILAERNGWYCIAYPTGQPCYIAVKDVDGTPPATIPEGGVALPVKGDRVKLHVRPWGRSTVVGTIESNDIVSILGRRGQWYKVVAPPSARAWVSSKYVKLVKEAALPEAQAPQPGTVPGLKPAASRPADEAAGATKPLTPSQHFRELVATLRRQHGETPAPAEQPEPEEDEYEEFLEKVDAELEAIRAETERRKAEIRQRLAPGTAPAMTGPVPVASSEGAGYTGWVEFIGYGAQRPAAYRLVKGGEVLFLLRSPTFNLGEFTNKRVQVDGRVELARGFQANVLVVDRLTILDEGPLPNAPPPRLPAREESVTVDGPLGSVEEIGDSIPVEVVTPDEPVILPVEPATDAEPMAVPAEADAVEYSIAPRTAIPAEDTAEDDVLEPVGTVVVPNQ